MTRFRDLAVFKIGQADDARYREESRTLTAQAQVYALLALADAIHTQKEEPNE